MRYFVYPFRILRTVHWTYPLVRYLLKSICGTEQGRFLRSFLGYGSDAEEWNLLTLVHGSSPCGSGEVPIHPVRRSHAGHCGQPSFFLIYILCKGSALTALESANGLISYRASRFLQLYRLRPAASDAVLSQSADPSPPMMNGIFEVCHWTWASFLTNPSRRPLLCLSVFCPRAAGSESLKCSFFTFPLRGICFKMSVCSRSVFYWEVLRKWLRLEFLSPYLRLFSFCDYTIAHA